MTPQTVAQAYEQCEAITRAQARNFSYGIALLRRPQRQALSAIYAFARRIDDIGDGDLPAADKLAGLAEARTDVLAAGGDSVDPVLLALGDAARRFPIPLPAFGELIDGCVSDVLSRSYDTFADLEAYCRLVAGSVGRLSLGVFGARDRVRAVPIADDLGVALQLTNILRDIAEDHAVGRVYLPAEDLHRFDVPAEALGTLSTAALPGWSELMALQCTRAEQWYGRGLTLLPLLDRRSTACTAAMAGIYHRLLRRIAADPAEVLHSRVRLPAGEKALVAARALTLGRA